MSESETQAMGVLDELMQALNARDRKALQATFNYPQVRLASGKLVVIEKPGLDSSAVSLGEDWHHSAWIHRNVVQSSDDKVHIDVRFTRYREDGSEISTYDSMYVVTCQHGHWGVQARSSFAP